MEGRKEDLCLTCAEYDNEKDCMLKEQESRELEADLLAMVKEYKYRLGMLPAVGKILLRVAKHNDWQQVKTELEKK